MNRRLRELHRGAFVALTVAVPAVFLAGWRARETTLALLPEAGPYEGVGASVLEHPRVRLRGETLEIELPRDWNEPDVLVYATGEAPEQAALPADARLLGTLGSRLPWSPGASHVAFYSLAHQVVVYSATVVRESDR